MEPRTDSQTEEKVAPCECLARAGVTHPRLAARTTDSSIGGRAALASTANPFAPVAGLAFLAKLK